MTTTYQPPVPLYALCNDDVICELRVQHLLKNSSGADRARLLASSTPGSGAWIHALPTVNMGLRLSNEDIRISVGLRLGAPIVSENVLAASLAIMRSMSSWPGHSADDKAPNEIPFPLVG